MIHEVCPANYGDRTLLAVLKTAIGCVNKLLGLKIPKLGTSIERPYLKRMKAETNAWVQRMRRAEHMERMDGIP